MKVLKKLAINMSYPKYDNLDLQVAEQVGSFEISEFANFIDQLLANNYLEHPTEIGVATFISSNGTKSLKPKQVEVLELILRRFPQTTCNRCRSTIELNEVIYSYENGGYCSFCQNQIEKNN